MTPEEVKKRVSDIRICSGDSEGAHSMEDELYADIIEAIRDGKIVDAMRCCEEALRSKDLSFPRWYA